MSDRSTTTVVVFACPKGQRRALRAVLDEDGGWDDLPEDGSLLTLGELYYAHDAPLDNNETMAAAIREAAPGATFAVWVDPKYEYPGVITAYAPDLGSFDGSCDSDGNPYVTLAEIEQLPDVGKLDGSDPLSAALARILGRAWFARFDHLRAEIEQLAAEPAGAR